MKLLSGKYKKGFIGLMLLCIFSMKFGPLLITSISMAKHHFSSVCKNTGDARDETTKEAGDDDSKDDEEGSAEKMGKLAMEFDIYSYQYQSRPASAATVTVIPIYIPTAIKEPLLAVPTLPPNYPSVA